MQLLLALTFLTLGAFTSAQTTCTSVTVRKEIRDLTSTERSIFLNGLRRATTGNPSILNRLAAVHLADNAVIHGGPNFLPWHRLFIRRLEGQLQLSDSRFALHYWDWTKDARTPETSVILSSSYFGGNSGGNCMSASFFGQIYANSPSRHCLTRDYADGTTPGSFYPRAITDAIVQQYETFVDFALSLEGGPHASPHNGCGGDMGSMQSPEDPLFFVHHSFIDYLYAQWQDLDYANRIWDYSGTNQDGSNAALTNSLVNLRATVQNVLDYSALCYRYQDTGLPDDYGTLNDMEWGGNTGAATPPSASTGGWVWDNNTQQWVWEGLVRRNYATTRKPPAPKPAAVNHAQAAKPHATAPAAEAAPESYQAPVANDCCAERPKTPTLRVPTDEEAEEIAKQYTAPLAHPRPVDDDWIKMNKMCVDNQRALEASYCAYIDKINAKIAERCDADAY